MPEEEEKLTYDRRTTTGGATCLVLTEGQKMNHDDNNECNYAYPGSYLNDQPCTQYRSVQFIDGYLSKFNRTRLIFVNNIDKTTTLTAALHCVYVRSTTIAAFNLSSSSFEKWRHSEMRRTSSRMAQLSFTLQ